MSPVRLGHHELLIRLASGGAANVFLVRDMTAPDPGRLLALKILLPSLASNEDFVNMFFAEAKIARSLRHPNVVTIAGFGLVEGIHCLAMEYVFGASLAQVLRASAKARKPLTVGVLLRITACVCDALHYAHELQDEGGQPLNLVHRDVTPQNILIGFNGVPKLTDFGIAKATNRGWETQAGIVKGKFSYMSPEQALGKRVDRRSDIFGTGIVLWEALTGRDLFRGSTPMEVLSAIRNQKIEPPSKVVPGLTPIVDPIVMKALRRSPRQRYQTAAEMRDDIEDLIRRAGVDIDSQLISREFAAIYGNEIGDRALALRQAMSGRGDLEHLATVLGGSVLNPKHLPVIPGGMTDPDPLGLFGESSGPLPEIRDEAPLGPALPARNDQSFSNGAMPPPVPSEEFEIVEEEEPQFEAEVGPSLTPDVPDERLVSGWDDSTAMSVPDDELLSMISEEDATIGYLPPELAERFGLELQKALDDEADRSFDDEMTVGMPEGPALSQLRALKGDEHTSGTTPWDDPQRTSKVRSAKTESLRPVPRAPSVLMEEEQFLGKGRPFPRAPSLDMEGDDRTPLPHVQTSVTRARSTLNPPKQVSTAPRSISAGPAAPVSAPVVPSLQLEEEPVSPSMPGEVVPNTPPQAYSAPVELELDELSELDEAPVPVPANGAAGPVLSSPPPANALSPESLLAIARERSASELRAVPAPELLVSAPSPFGASTDLSPPQVARPAFRMTSTMWLMIVLLVVALLSAGAAIGLYLARM